MTRLAVTLTAVFALAGVGWVGLRYYGDPGCDLRPET